MIVEHKTAVIARLNTDTVLATCGHEGRVLDRPDRYWTIYADSGLRRGDRLGGLPTSAMFTYTIHCVGEEPEQAQRLADRVIGLLAGWQPTVPGFAPFRVRHASSEPAELDAGTIPALHFTVDRFTLTTQPA